SISRGRRWRIASSAVRCRRPTCCATPSSSPTRSTATPGRTAPVASLTTPAIALFWLCANATVDNEPRAARMKPSLNARSGLIGPPAIEAFGRPPVGAEIVLRYGFELEGVEPAGATPFWRAAEVADVDARRLLVAAGADPNIATTEGVTPLLAA